MDSLTNFIIKVLVLLFAAALTTAGLGMLHVPVAVGPRFAGSEFILGGIALACLLVQGKR